jgi:hypothetical protein
MAVTTDAERAAARRRKRHDVHSLRLVEPQSRCLQAAAPPVGVGGGAGGAGANAESDLSPPTVWEGRKGLLRVEADPWEADRANAIAASIPTGDVTADQQGRPTVLALVRSP